MFRRLRLRTSFPITGHSTRPPFGLNYPHLRLLNTSKSRTGTIEQQAVERLSYRWAIIVRICTDFEGWHPLSTVVGIGGVRNILSLRVVGEV